MHLLTKSKVASRSTQLKEFHNKTQTGDNLSTWITKEEVSKANNEGFRCKYNGTIINAEHFEENPSALQVNRVMGKSNSDDI